MNDKNNYRIATIALAIIWIGTVGGFAYFFLFGVSRLGPDGREIVNVTPGEKQFVLQEMRQLLEATQQIHVAMGKGNREEAAQAAESVGMGMVEELAAVESTILFKLPAPMKKLGLGTHREFDNLAQTIRSNATDSQVMEHMGQLMSRCVACHATYRLP